MSNQVRRLQLSAIIQIKALNRVTKVVLSQDVKVLRIHPDKSVHFYIEQLCGRQKNSF